MINEDDNLDEEKQDITGNSSSKSCNSGKKNGTIILSDVNNETNKVSNGLLEHHQQHHQNRIVSESCGTSMVVMSDGFATTTTATTTNTIPIMATENENSHLEMITLGSNNNVFMTAKTLHGGPPVYSSKELPRYLQDSLEESLSRISITSPECDNVTKEIEFRDYTSEESLPDLTALITKDLSEPYSIYTYRYFLHNWPQLSFLAYYETECVGAIVCKLDQHRKNVWRGYIAMLVVHKDYRRYKIGTKLVQKAIRRMIEQGCDEVVLETEVTNRAALNLYENLGFVRDKRLLRYYLNGVDAWRLKLWLI